MNLSKLFVPAAIGGALALAFSGSASATTCTDKVWSASGGSQIVSENTVKLKDGNTSVEAENLNLTVPFGTAISFKPILGEGVTCTAGAPRVFVKIGDTYFNSFDSNTDQCGGSDGVVTFTPQAAGKITHAGIVFDNSQQGTVTIKNLTIGQKVIDFTACTPAASPSPSVTPSPTKSASATPSASASPTKSASATPTKSTSTSATPVPVGNEQPALPVTGSSLTNLIMAGAGVLLLGTAALIFARRKRDSFQA